MRKDYYWRGKRRGNPNWRKSDFQDSLTHNPDHQKENWIILIVIGALMIMGSCAGY